MYIRKTILCIFMVLIGTRLIYGQTEVGETTKSERGRELTIEEDPLKVKFVKDENGEFVPLVESFTYEEIREFVDKRHLRAQQNRPATFNIKRLNINGTSHKEFAVLRVTAVFQVDGFQEDEFQADGSRNASTEIGSTPNHVIETTERDDKTNETEWSRIPFQFLSAVLMDEPTYSGDGEWKLLPNDGKGLELWFRGGSGEQTLEMQFKVPVTNVDDRSRVSFHVPTASMSNLELHIEETDITASVDNSVTHEQKNLSTATVVTADGLTDNVTITWQKKQVGETSATNQIRVQGDIDVTIDRLGLITCDVTLGLKSLTEIEKFEVRLPTNSTIVSGDQQAFEIKPVASGPENLQGNLYEFTLSRPAREPEQVVFRFETSHYGESGIEPINVAAVTVRGAYLQSGRVRLRVRGDLRVEPTISHNVLRVTDPSLSESNATQPVRAAYEYFGQPCEIKIDVKQQQKRISVVPTHFVFVNGNQNTIELVTRLSYRNRGASISNLEVDLKDWKEQEVRSSEYEVSDVYQAESATANIRFAEPAQGEFDLDLISERELLGDAGTLKLNLPTPIADSIGAGLLVVIPSDNVSLTFPESSGFFDEPLPENLASELDQFPTQNDQVRCFRFKGEIGPGTFPIEYKIHEATTDLNMQHEILLSADTAKVQQKFVFDVRYKSRPTVNLVFPYSLYRWLSNRLERHKIKVTVNGQVVSSLRSSVERSGLVPVSIPLRPAKLGENVVELEYDWRIDSLKSATSERIEIPLATNLDGNIVTNRVIVDPRPGIRIDEFANSEDWQQDLERFESFSINHVSAFTRSRPTHVSLQVTRSRIETEASNESTASPVLVERAWLQTWISGGDRRDWAVFKIKTSKQIIRVRHPSTISAEKMIVLLNGVPVTPVDFSPSKNTLSIGITDRQRTSHVLEIKLMHGERPRVGAMNFELPEVVDTTEVTNWVWQLVLPPNEHVLRATEDLTPSETWSWTGWYWRRRATHDQRYLEALTGASSKEVAPIGANEYLFTAPHAPTTSISVYSATRRSMVAIGSGATLLFGLLLIYVKALRSPIVFFFAAVILGTVAFLFPGPAVLLAQASALGVILALCGQIIALILQRLSLNRVGIQVAKHHDSHSIRAPRNEEISKVVTAALSVEPIPVVASDSKA